MPPHMAGPPHAWPCLSCLVQAEVAHLDLTGYNPALIASYLARNTSLSDAMINTPGAGNDANSNADLKLQYDILLEREQRKK